MLSAVEDNDTRNFEEAMQSVNRDEWKRAIEDELEASKKNKEWNTV